MKTLMALALLATSFASEARSPIYQQSASVYRVLNLATPFGEEYVSGEVKLNYVTNKVTLMLVGKNPCPPNAICFRGPHITRVEVDLVERASNHCGQRIYVAKKDDLPVDGSLVELKIVDNSHLACRIRPMAPTVITYKEGYYDRRHGEYIEKKGNIFATALK